MRNRTQIVAGVLVVLLAGWGALDAQAQTATERQILTGINQLRASATDQQNKLNALQTSLNGQGTSLATVESTLASMQIQLTTLQTLVGSLQSSVNSIPRDPRKKYYLTTTPVDGAHVLNACASGYHVASLWEIFDTSNLAYDTSLGQSSPDSGRGPSSLHSGWVRTGWRQEDADSPGSGNCDVWTSADPAKSGTVVELNNQWDESPVNLNPAVNPWRAFFSPCGNSVPVWCVQN
jgi:hypothetical protein